MNANLESRINEIINSGFETPSILKRVLVREIALLKDDQLNRDILGMVYIEPTYISPVGRREKFSGAVMVLATSIGLIIVQEGSTNLELEFGGYSAQYIPFSKISCVELDSCLLLGEFKLSLGALNNPDMFIEFDTSRHFKDFDEIISIIRGKMTELERHLTS